SPISLFVGERKNGSSVPRGGLDEGEIVNDQTILTPARSASSTHRVHTLGERRTGPNPNGHLAIGAGAPERLHEWCRICYAFADFDLDHRHHPWSITRRRHLPQGGAHGSQIQTPSREKSILIGAQTVARQLQH